MNRHLRAVLLLVALVAILTVPVVAWDRLWVHQYTSTVFVGASGTATGGDGVYASGSVFGDLSGSTVIGGTDAYVRKLDHDGNEIWTRRVGTTSYDDSQGVATDGNGVFITGTTCGAFPGFVRLGGCDAYAARVNSSGDVVWVTQFGTAGLELPYQYGAIALHSSGVYVAGKTNGTFPGATPVAGFNTFLARLDPSTGAVSWVRQFGVVDPGNFAAGGVGVDDTGVAVGANAELSFTEWRAEVRKFNHDGTPQWSRVFDNSTLPCGHPIFSLTSHRGHVYLIGQTYEWALSTCVDQPFGQSYVIGLLENLDETGSTVWQRRVKAGMPHRPGGAGIAPFTGAKVVHVTDDGVFIGANVRKLRFAGDVARTPHSDQSQCSDPGPVENAAFQGFDGYVRRYDLDGNVIWTHQFGSNLYELVSGLGSDATRLFAIGYTRCVVEEGVDPETGAAVDAFVVSFALDPSSQSGRIQLIVGQLETLSDAGRVAQGNYNALVGHLESALSALAESKTDPARAALQGFANLAGNYGANGHLPAADAGALISAALAIAGEL